MERQAMNLMLQAELEHVGDGDRGSEQNVFRAIYNMRRRRDLGKDPETPRLISLTHAIQATQSDAPDFIPLYDGDYFRESTR